MDSDNKIDLSQVNKTEKKLKLPSPTSIFRRQKGQKRDEVGKFTAGSGGLSAVKKFNLGRALPLILVISLVGGYLVFKSFAGTYHTCSTTTNSYTYSEECVTSSDEASVIRLYYGIFNRAPDKSGLQYWTGKLGNKTITFTEMARQFMGSSEFKNKYGTLSNEAFVKAMYPQVFGRAPDPSGLKYYTGKLTAKTITREGMMVEFTQSSEMKRSYAGQVAQALGITPERYLKTVNNVPTDKVTCYGQKIRKADGKDWCSVSLSSAVQTPEKNIVVASVPISSYVSSSANYTLCGLTELKNTIIKPANNINVGGGLRTIKGQLTGGSALAVNAYEQRGGNVLVWVPGTQGARRFCQSRVIPQNFADEVLIYASSSGQPANASAEFEMSSFLIGSNIDDLTTPELQGRTTNGKTDDCTSIYNSCDYTVGSKVVRIPGRWASTYTATAQTPKPDWVHEIKVPRNGKFNLNIHTSEQYSSALGMTRDEYANSRGPVLKIRVMEKTTKKPIKADLFEDHFDSTSKSWKPYKYPDASKAHKVHWSNSNLWLEGKTDKPTYVVVEIDVLEGQRTPMVSFSDDYWITDSDYYKSQTFTVFND